MSTVDPNLDNARRNYGVPFVDAAGRVVLGLFRNAHELIVLFLMTATVAVTKRKTAPDVIRPLFRRHLATSGVRLFPMIALLGLALGFVVIGQAFKVASQLGGQSIVGSVMVTVVIRELGPLLTALLLLARAGAATVVQLGTLRALGEVEALEAMGIDPIHYLVVPRVSAMAVSAFALSAYLIGITLASGYGFTFFEGVGLLPAEYMRQLAGSLVWPDFVLFAFKTVSFGVLIGLVACHEGLARPLRLEDVSRATTSAVAKSVIGIVAIDAVFVLFYLVE